jgi:hypothetical protein
VYQLGSEGQGQGENRKLLLASERLLTPERVLRRAELVARPFPMALTELHFTASLAVEPFLGSTFLPLECAIRAGSKLVHLRGRGLVSYTTRTGPRQTAASFIGMRGGNAKTKKKIFGDYNAR